MKNKGFTLVEVMVVLILLTLAFMVFLQALNTGKTVRVHSEIRTIQALILNNLQNQVRARRFDENITEPWSSEMGTEIGESTISNFDDIDDFDGYNISNVDGYPGFSYSIAVNYVSSSNKFHVAQASQTNYKSVLVKVSHLTVSAISDTMIISSGL